MPLLFRKTPPFQAGERLDISGLAVRLRVDARARRVGLRIDPARREVVATAPRARDLYAAAQFAGERRLWALAQLARLPAPAPIASTPCLTLFGETWLPRADDRRPRVLPPASPGQPGVLAGCGEGTPDRRLLMRAVAQVADQRFAALVDLFSRELGVERPSLTISDTRSRWGSCTPPRLGRRGRVRISLRLALAPAQVATYVAAHECAHLLEANHGPRFWALVERLVGDPTPHRAWLRAHGACLHASDDLRAIVLPSATIAPANLGASRLTVRRRPRPSTPV